MKSTWRQGICCFMNQVLFRFLFNKCNIFCGLSDIFVDVLSIGELLWYFYRSVLMIDDPTGYGRIIRDINGNLLKIVEEKDCTGDERKIKEWNPGIYIFKIPGVFKILDDIKTNNASKEYYLTDAIGLAQQSNMSIKAIKIANSNEVMGVNTADQLKELES